MNWIKTKEKLPETCEKWAECLEIATFVRENI